DAAKPISAATQSALDTKETAANKSTATALGTSDDLFPTQRAVKTYVDDAILAGITSEKNRATDAEALKIAKLDVFKGDVTGKYDETKVAKIQGVEVATTTPTTGQVLTYNNSTSKWEPAALDLGVSPLVKKTTDYPITLTDYTVVLGKTATGDVTFTLPTGVVVGRIFRIVNLSNYKITLSVSVRTAVDLTTNVILSGNAIDGTTLGNKMTIQWDGDEWIQVGN
ncbi:MAG: hypothetical protein JZU53_01460, partial [Paludibacter sp.]|nr:hypothetical protein [Paludibacter sp.]